MTNNETQNLERTHKERTQKLVKMIMIPIGSLFYFMHLRLEFAIFAATFVGFLSTVVNAYLTGKTDSWRNTNFYPRADKVDAIRWIVNLVIVDSFILYVFKPSTAVTASLWTVFLIAAQLDLHKESYRKTVLVICWLTGTALLWLAPQEPLPWWQTAYLAIIMGAIPMIFEYLEAQWIQEVKENAESKKLEAEMRFRSQLLERDAQLGMQSRMLVHELSNLVFILDLGLQRETINREILERSVHFIKRINRLVLEDLRQDAQLGNTTVKGVVDDSELLLRKSVMNKGIHLHFDLDEQAASAEFQEYAGTLFLILRNLAMNSADAILAKKERTPGEQITVDICKTDDFLQVTVRDTGIGMTQAQLNSVLSGEGKTTKEGGNGIGMKFVVDQCNRNHFQLSGTSVPNEGTEFTLRIPLDKTAATKAA